MHVPHIQVTHMHLYYWNGCLTPRQGRCSCVLLRCGGHSCVACMHLPEAHATHDLEAKSLFVDLDEKQSLMMSCVCVCLV